MKCSNCGHDMVASRAGWLCPACGHAELRSDSNLPQQPITTGKEAHEQMQAAGAAHDLAASAAAAASAKPAADAAPAADPAAPAGVSSSTATSPTPDEADTSAPTPTDDATTATAATTPATDEATAATSASADAADTAEPAPPPTVAAPWEAPATPGAPAGDDATTPSADATAAAASTDDTTTPPADATPAVSDSEAAVPAAEMEAALAAVTAATGNVAAATPDTSTSPADEATATADDNTASHDEAGDATTGNTAADDIAKLMADPNITLTDSTTTSEAAASDPEPVAAATPEAPATPVAETDTPASTPDTKADETDTKPDAEPKDAPSTESKDAPSAEAKDAPGAEPQDTPAPAIEPQDAPSTKPDTSADTKPAVAPVAIHHDIPTQPAGQDKLAPDDQTPADDKSAESIIQGHHTTRDDKPKKDEDDKPESEKTDKDADEAADQPATDAAAKPTDARDSHKHHIRHRTRHAKAVKAAAPADAAPATDAPGADAATALAAIATVAADIKPSAAPMSVPVDTITSAPTAAPDDASIEPPAASAESASQTKAAPDATSTDQAPEAPSTDAPPADVPAADASSISDATPADDAANDDPRADDAPVDKPHSDSDNAPADAPEADPTLSTDTNQPSGAATSTAVTDTTAPADSPATPTDTAAPAVPAPAAPPPPPGPEALVADTAPGTKPTHQPTTPRRISLRLILTLILSLVVVGVVAAIAYFLIAEPKVALSRYLSHLAKAKTAATTIAVTQTGGAYNLALKFDGLADISKPAQPALSLTINGMASPAKLPTNVNVAPSTDPVAGNLVTTAGTAYFKLTGLGGLSSVIPATAKDTWYQYPASASTATCFKQNSGLGGLLDPATIAKLPITQSSFVGIEDLGKAKSLHYRGHLAATNLTAALAAFNQPLAAGCQLNLSADTLKNLTISYDVWRSWTADRLSVTVTDSATKATQTLVLDTASYGRQVQVDPPSPTQDAAPILQDLMSGSPAGSHTAARQADLARLGKVLDVYATAHAGAYPATAALAAKQSFTGNDPLTAKPYQIIATRPTAAGQIQYLLSATCSATHTATVLAPANPHKYAILALSDDAKTSLCYSN